MDPTSFAADYRRDAAAWAAAPRAAEVRARLNDAARALAAAAEAISNLERHELALLDLPRSAAHEFHDQLATLAHRAANAAADLKARCGRGGNRRLLGALGRLPPRGALLVRLRRDMPGATRSEILDAAAEVLAACGEDDTGLTDVLVRLMRNQAKSPPVPPLNSSAETVIFACMD